MNIGLTISRGRVSPCFSGVSLLVLDAEAGFERVQEDDTGGWQSLDWGRELARRNVSVLLCSGIDRFLWGSLQGHGIEVVPEAVGLMDEVVDQWQNGKLPVPKVWPFVVAQDKSSQGCGGMGRGVRRRKGRCGGR